MAVNAYIGSLTIPGGAVVTVQDEAVTIETMAGAPQVSRSGSLVELLASVPFPVLDEGTLINSVGV